MSLPPTSRRIGGIMRAAALSADQRRDIAKKAAEARWSGVPKKPKQRYTTMSLPNPKQELLVQRGREHDEVFATVDRLLAEADHLLTTLCEEVIGRADVDELVMLLRKLPTGYARPVAEAVSRLRAKPSPM